MDRLSALRIFHQVAELGSFAGAGRRLGLSPAAISKTIARLEDQVGARLINRTTRRVALTEEGRVYLAHAVRVLEAVEEADSALSPHRAGPTGTLRVSAPATVTLTMLSPAIPDFLARYPDLRLELELDDRRIDIIRDGFDLAIRASVGLEDSALIARRLTAMTHVLCSAPDYFDRRGARCSARGIRCQPDPAALRRDRPCRRPPDRSITGLDDPGRDALRDLSITPASGPQGPSVWPAPLRWSVSNLSA